MNSCQPNIRIDLSPLQMLISLHQDIKPNGKECLGTTRRVERLRHQPGKGSPTAWENERTAACERIQLPDKTLRFPLSNHATIISIPRAVMCSDREGLLLVSSWQWDSGQNTAVTARGERKEVNGTLHPELFLFQISWKRKKVQKLRPNAKDQRDVQLSFYCDRRNLCKISVPKKKWC